MEKVEPSYKDFHGLRDFYSLIRQMSQYLIQYRKTIEIEKSLESFFAPIQTIIDRNFSGIDKFVKLKPKFSNKFFKNIFLDSYPMKELTNFQTKPLDLIKQNIFSTDSRYLMIIAQNPNSIIHIFDYFIEDLLKKRIRIVGSSYSEGKDY